MTRLHLYIYTDGGTVTQSYDKPTRVDLAEMTDGELRVFIVNTDGKFFELHANGAPTLVPEESE